MRSSPDLAALLVVGDSREHAQRALDSLYAQTIVDGMEIVVVDLKTRNAPELSVSSRTSTRYVTLGRDATWAEARAIAARLAAAPILAFIEGHCIAAPGWAEALVRAHEQPWAAVGYAFTNPHPESYLSRATLASKYGCWLHPTTSRPARVLPCGNVAYKRDVLLSLGDELENLLTPDFVVHERFNQRGLGMWVESHAIVAHNSLVKLSDLMASSFLFCRVLASKRAEIQRWNRVRRIGYGLATPIVSPGVALWRLFASHSDTPADWTTLLIYLPVVLAKGVASALGESVGYLVGAGSSEIQFIKWELHAGRSRER
jgi:hypothetical protein